jgi:hypothetical protein
MQQMWFCCAASAVPLSWNELLFQKIKLCPYISLGEGGEVELCWARFSLCTVHVTAAVVHSVNYSAGKVVYVLM